MAKSQDEKNEDKRKKAIERYRKRHKEIRVFMDLTIEEEAKRSGVAASTISNMENGVREPLNSTAEVLVEYGLRVTDEQFRKYDVPPEELGIKKVKK